MTAPSLNHRKEDIVVCQPIKQLINKIVTKSCIVE